MTFTPFHWIAKSSHHWRSFLASEGTRRRAKDEGKEALKSWRRRMKEREWGMTWEQNWR